VTSLPYATLKRRTRLRSGVKTASFTCV